MSQRVIRRELFNADSTSRKPLVNGPLLLPFHAAVHVVREQYALQPLALAVASVHVFRAVAHSRLFTANLFCLVFGKKFNIVSALFVHQSLTLPQKNDSRGGLFWCGKGLACACGKMNFYLNKLLFAAVSVSFGANWSAFWCKTQGKMLLNAGRFAAKCEKKSINIHSNCINKPF